MLFYFFFHVFNLFLYVHQSTGVQIQVVADSSSFMIKLTIPSKNLYIIHGEASHFCYEIHTLLQVDSILEKERFTLEDLLDEDEIIQECKALNTRLINL